MRKTSLFLCIFVFSVYAYAQNQLCIYNLDVGQGDSILIITPAGKSILIDAGGSGDYADLETPMAAVVKHGDAFKTATIGVKQTSGQDFAWTFPGLRARLR